ncbi:hypothetical protein EYF80_000231 [Liparis tanakae]|uniref:Uncharacterized protein n=1 Tax=Liparis tanakae TaxID=230148 RepID=A0A4Z2JJ17_9TELE|nr:hypothetical protein EYF80_000231 [Liparis tanakae]
MRAHILGGSTPTFHQSAAALSHKEILSSNFRPCGSCHQSKRQEDSSIASVLEPADEVGADALEALPAVLGGDAVGFGFGLLCGASGGLPGLGDDLLGLGALAWLGLGGLLGLDGFRSSDGLVLGRHRRFTRLLNRLGGLGRGGLGHGGLGHGGLWPGGQEGNLGLVRVFLAHGRAVDSGSLAGVAQLPHVPHHLGEEVARVEVVGAAQVGLALEVAVVGAPRGLALARPFAGDTQAGVVPGSGHHHGAGVFGLGAEPDGLVPDAALRLLLLLLLLLRRLPVVVAAVVGLSA